MARILIVDDEPDIRFLLRFNLEHAGHDVIEASNGQIALDVVQKEIPDVIVTDLMMPMMGGRQFIEHLKANPATAEIPVILCTAEADPEPQEDVTVVTVGKEQVAEGIVPAVGELLRREGN